MMFSITCFLGTIMNSAFLIPIVTVASSSDNDINQSGEGYTSTGQSYEHSRCETVNQTIAKLTKQICYQTCEGNKNWLKDCFEVSGEEECRRCYCEHQNKYNVCITDENMKVIPLWKLFTKSFKSGKNVSEVRFTDVLWIGAHNAGSDKLRLQYDERSRRYTVSTLSTNLMCKVIRYVISWPAVREASRITATDQFNNIWQLLQLGVRFFDMDICLDGNNDLRICHCLFGRRMSIIFSQFRHWIFVNPRDILILRFADGMENQNIHDRLADELHNYLGQYLIDENMFQWPYDLNRLQHGDRRILVIVRAKHSSYSWAHVEDVYIRGVYTNSPDINVVAKSQIKEVETYRNDTLNVINSFLQRSWLSAWDILLNAENYLNKTSQHNLELQNRLIFSQKWNDSLHGANVILLNFVNRDVCKRLIRLKLLENFST